MFDNFNLNAIWESGGILISIVGYIIVFFALLLLYMIFALMQKVLVSRQRKKLKMQGHRAADSPEINLSGEVTSAISMALHLHFAEVHDFENTILTIKKVQRPYSPWSSKLYGLRQTPRK
ncbi:MAG: OadG family protein [Melioribacteraceae bacterium]|nr:OadG family protein [Melioribacteraceae bacterium]